MHAFGGVYSTMRTVVLCGALEECLGYGTGAKRKG